MKWEVDFPSGREKESLDRQGEAEGTGISFRIFHEERAWRIKGN